MCFSHAMLPGSLKQVESINPKLFFFFTDRATLVLYVVFQKFINSKNPSKKLMLINYSA